jgi:hypothetical protein
MDPLGFGLENFDATGAWRTADGKAPVDSVGELPDGTKFQGPVELKAVLMGKKDQFVRSLTEKMLTYALGRGVDESDKCAVDDIQKKVTKDGYRFSALIEAVIESDPFRKRGVEEKGN